MPHYTVPLRTEEDEAGVVAMRVVDVLVAAAGLAFFAPLMALIAAVVFADGGRPVIFSQIRLGRRGRHFRLYKFRKFDGKEKVCGGALTVKNDPRLTRVGRLLVWTKLDELPQLWNVLKGDMAIVGPRPETLDFADCFEDRHRWVLDYKPGIFGPAQVYFRNEGSLYQHQMGGDSERFYRDVLFPLKARIDWAYYPTRTLFRDVAWIVRGVFAVFGWGPSPRDSLDLAAEVEGWIRRSSLHDSADGVFGAPSQSKQ